MKNTSFLLVLATCFLAGNTLAETISPETSPAPWTWVATISAGPVWTSAGNTQTLELAPFVTKAYVANTSSNTLVNGELFVGFQKKLSGVLQGQLGLALAATSNAKLPGRIWDNGYQVFDNFSYQYKIQHRHVALKGKLLADGGYWFIPWLSGSLGAGFNNAHAFDNEETGCSTPSSNPNFISHTKTAFTYTLGAGLQKALTPHWQAGLGYEYADWGKSALGRAPGQTLNTGLALNHVYTLGILFNLTYVA